MKGFNIGKKGSSIESVLYEKNKISLLTRGNGVEVSLHTIEKDRLFFVYPTEDSNVLEFYYILSGEVLCEIDGEKQILGQQDYFTAKGISDPVHFTAISDVTFLWVITEQTFAHFSKDIKDMMAIVKQVEQKDHYTYMHSDRVSEYSIKIAKKIKINNDQVKHLANAAVLHDIGKIHIPKEILNKSGRLTYDEYELVKKHSSDGAVMVKGTYYDEVAPIIEQHHERLDGSGYPFGLKGDDILLEARIIAVSDTFDAMTEDRAYRKAYTAQYAMGELNRLKGIKYDVDVVVAFEKVLKEEGRI